MTNLTAEIGATRLDIVVADITTLDVDAIVNAANRTLLGRRRGRRRHPSRGRTRIAGRMRDAGRLRHRLGQDHPRLPAEGAATSSTRSGRCGAAAAKTKKRCSPAATARALDLAAAHALTSIAYPAISTGIYRFPADLAARIAVGTVASEIAARPRGLTRVMFCCFAAESAEHHKDAFAELGLV